MQNKIFYMAIVDIFGIATRRCYEVYKQFNSPEEIFNFKFSDVNTDEFLKPDEITKIRNYDFSKIGKIAKKTLSLGHDIITPDDEYYPSRLLQIENFPLVLYSAGNKELLKNSDLVAMVGTKNPTSYGIQAAKYLSEGLSSFNMTVLSGMTAGIDTACHASALNIGAPTVAVMVTDLEGCYPKGNQTLKELIRKNGVLITEFPLGISFKSHHFYIRNRVEAGMSCAVVVVEAAEKSGSLTTATHAIEQGKDVFAVPNSIFEKSSVGCLKLLDDGAYPAYSPKDIADKILRYRGGILPQHTIKVNITPPKKEVIFEKEIHQNIYNMLSNAKNINDICVELEVSINELSAELVFMEALGQIESMPGRMYKSL